VDDEIKRLEKENEELAAGQCVVEGALVGNPYGNLVCNLEIENARLKHVNDNLTVERQMLLTMKNNLEAYVAQSITRNINPPVMLLDPEGHIDHLTDLNVKLSDQLITWKIWAVASWLLTVLFAVFGGGIKW
jgi:hypothetical protein